MYDQFENPILDRVPNNFIDAYEMLYPYSTGKRMNPRYVRDMLALNSGMNDIIRACQRINIPAWGEDWAWKKKPKLMSAEERRSERARIRMTTESLERLQRQGTRRR
jgi:hypothetical protein